MLNLRIDSVKNEFAFSFTIGRREGYSASKTISNAIPDHNNLVSRANLDDADLASTMKSFMEQMTSRQTALEEHIANISIIIQRAKKGFTKDNSGDARTHEL